MISDLNPVILAGPPVPGSVIIEPMIAQSLGTAFGITFVAELGDKTQLAILTLSARYGFPPVFLGAAIAFAVLNALSVTLGAVAARFVPEGVIRYVSAAVFIVFGFLSFREEKEGARERTGRGPFLTTLVAVGLMELGDKTQLALIALTSKFKAPFFVFLGGTLALWFITLIGALAGDWLGGVLPFRWIRRVSGVVFITFGVLIAAGVV